MIGDKKYWNQGLGTETIKLLLDFGFNIHNLNNIMLTVFDYNKRAQKVYEKTGFKLIGKRRKAKFYNGKYYDELFMDALVSEFRN